MTVLWTSKSGHRRFVEHDDGYVCYEVKANRADAPWLDCGNLMHPSLPRDNSAAEAILDLARELAAAAPARAVLEARLVDLAARVRELEDRLGEEQRVVEETPLLHWCVLCGGQGRVLVPKAGPCPNLVKGGGS